MLSGRSQRFFSSLVTFGLLAACSSTKSPEAGGAAGTSTGSGSGSSTAGTSGNTSPTSGSSTSGGTAGTGTTTSGGGNGGTGTASTGSPGGTGAGGTGATTGTGTGAAGASSGSGGTSTPGSYKSVTIVESSRAAGATATPEHGVTLPTTLTPKAAAAGTGLVITVDPTMKRQTITGFGAAMTEVVASTIAILTPAQQTEIYNALYSPSGNNYTLTRTHIGSCDFALSAYTYDDNGGTADPTLAQFSIANDMTYLIPGLKAAQTASGGALKILGTMWTSPPWMKDQKIYNGGTVQPANYAALGSYFSKYVQAYKAQGLDIWALTPANEPLGVGGARESMIWTSAAMNTFLQANLGPTLKADGAANNFTPPKIFIYDHNKGAGPNTDELLWTKLMFGDPTTAPFLAGTALHWYNSTFEVFEATLDALHAIPNAGELLFDEGTADGFIFNVPAGAGHDSTEAQTVSQINAAWASDDWFWNVDQYDWGYDYDVLAIHPEYAPVSRYARDIIVGLNHWYTGWIDWVAVLNKYGALNAATGGVGNTGPAPYSNTRGDPGVSHIPNGLPASIMVDEVPTMTGQTGTIHYTPIFYAMGQISKYIKPGATILTTTLSTMPNGDNTTTTDQTLFATGGQNTDGTTAVVIFNSATTAVPYTVVVGTQSVTGSIPPQAMQTLVWQ